MEANFVTDYIIPLSLFVVMMGMGLSLVIDDFKRVFVYPKSVLIGITGQLLLLPLVGFLIASSLKLEGELAVGLMLLAACPGGTMSNLITHLAKGDIALSITLTAVSSLITFISIPLIVGFALSEFMASNQSIQLPVLKTMATLFGITLLPVSIGMIIRHFYPVFALRQEKRVNTFSGIFISILVIGLIIKEKDIIVSAMIQSGPATALLNVSTMLIGFGLARLLLLDSRQATSITIEVGVQNSALAILIATNLLNNSVMAIPPAIYSLMMYVSSGFVIC